MKIVILDSDPAFGSATMHGGPPVGGLNCPRLLELGELESFETTRPDQVVDRAKSADVILTNKVVLSRSNFSKLPNLKLVSVLATGVNVVDIEAAKEHGVTVCNVPGYSTASTAQHTVALLLELHNRVGDHSRDVASGNWQNRGTFAYFMTPLDELEGKTLGIIGLGAIGTRVGEVARALGMHVVAHTRSERLNCPFPLVSFSELLEESDVVSLHCPLTPKTHRLMDRDAISKMKQGAMLINVARGPIVDEGALAEALLSGHLAGAATDVLEEEPPQAGSPLLSAPNCIITPHIAWATRQARQRLLNITAENIAAFLSGHPQNVVS